MKNKVFLILIIIAGLVLRILFFNSVTFIYDQARDLFTAINIWHGDPIKIIGPPTDIVGLNHGPLYWYLISPALVLGGGSILYARLLLILINLCAIFFIYDLTKDLFKNKSIALLSVLFYTISFEAVSYARWVSNPAPALTTIIISFWALYKLLQGKKWAIVVLFISWGLSMQFQLFMVYQIIVFAGIWIAIMGPKLPQISRKLFIITLAGFLTSVSTFILSELKFNFQGTKALLNFMKTQTAFGGSFINMFNTYIERLVNTFFVNIWGINLFFAGIMTFIFLLLSLQKIRNSNLKNQFIFLSIWLISPIIINFFASPNAIFVSTGALFPAIIATAFFIYSIPGKWKLFKYAALMIIIFANLSFILTKNSQGEVLFAVQKQMLLRDEEKTIDWVYKEANGKPFRLNTVTQPIFINSTWAYLFNWYGRSKYGYMPIWWGETQVNVPGADVKFADNAPTKLFFLIIEPVASGDDNYVKAVKYLENTRSKTVKTEKIGTFTVEEREITKEFTYTSGDVFRVIKTVDLQVLQTVQ